jgi:hypothetical protein
MIAIKKMYEKGLIKSKKQINEAKVKTVSVAEGERLGLSRFPNFSATGSIRGMKDKFYGKDALLVRSGGYIYNVSSEPEIYNSIYESKKINEKVNIGDEIRTKWGDGIISDFGMEKVFVKLNNGKEVVVDKDYMHAESRKLTEAKTDTKDIKVKNPGILDLPEGGFSKKTIDQLVKHMVKIAKDTGRSKVSKALQNLVRWNKNDDPDMSKKAQSVFDKYSKEMDKLEEKKESRKINEDNYGWSIISGKEWDAFEEYKEYVGSEHLLDELAQAMGTDELRSNLEYIFRMNDFTNSSYLEDDED